MNPCPIDHERLHPTQRTTSKSPAKSPRFATPPHAPFESESPYTEECAATPRRNPPTSRPGPRQISRATRRTRRAAEGGGSARSHLPARPPPPRVPRRPARTATPAAAAAAAAASPPPPRGGGRRRRGTWRRGPSSAPAADVTTPWRVRGREGEGRGGIGRRFWKVLEEWGGGDRWGMEGEVWWGWGWPNDVGSIDIDLSRFSFAAGFLMTTLMGSWLSVCGEGNIYRLVLENVPIRIQFFPIFPINFRSCCFVFGSFRARTIAYYNPAINTYRKDKRGERGVAGYRSVVSCSTYSNTQCVYDMWDRILIV